MKFERTDYGALAVLAPKGDLAGEEVEPFRRETHRCAQSNAQLIIDCGGITGYDSAGLESLTELSRVCVEHGGALKLCGLDAIGAKVMEITRLNAQFETFDDVEAAIRSFS